MAVVIVNVSMDSEHDRDILRWLGKQPNRSAAVREACREKMTKEEGVTLADVLAEIKALPSRLSVMAVGAEAVPEAGEEEPAAAAANLDGLLGRLGNGDLG